MQRISKTEVAINKLPMLKDAQVEYVLLRACLSIPKMMYTLRTTDPTNHQLCWQKCDDICREALTRILGKPLDHHQWQQAQLPTALGGLGLTCARDIAPAAFVASVLSAQDLKLRILARSEEDYPANIQPALLTYLCAKMGEETTIDSPTGSTQEAISLIINLELLFNHIIVCRE